MPLLSVVTSIYNCEKYLKLSLDSLLNQSFQDFEIIIINDGSDDNTLAIAQDVLGSFRGDFNLISHQDRLGVFPRRSEAIRASKGKYIAIHDGDDVSLPKRFEKQVKFLENNQNIWCYGSTALKIDDENKDIGVMDYPPSTFAEFLPMLINKCMNPQIDSSSMFNRDIFLKLGGYSENKNIYLVADFDLWCKSVLNGFNIVNSKEPTIKYRTNSQGNTIKHKQEMIQQHMLVWRNFIFQWKKNHLKSEN